MTHKASELKEDVFSFLTQMLLSSQSLALFKPDWTFTVYIFSYFPSFFHYSFLIKFERSILRDKPLFYVKDVIAEVASVFVPKNHPSDRERKYQSVKQSSKLLVKAVAQPCKITILQIQRKRGILFFFYH